MKPSYLLLCLCLFSCGTTQYTPEDYPETQLRWGAGGGFSGQMSRYALLDNGDIFYAKSAVDSMVQIHSIDENLAKQLCTNAVNLNLSQVRKVPTIGQSTMQQYLKVMNAEGSSEIQWSDPKEIPNQGVTRLFSQLMAMASNPSK